MGLFRKKVKDAVIEKPENKPKFLFQQGFTQAKSFRGHKRFHVSFYGYHPAEEGIAAFRASGSNLDKADILLKGYSYEYGRYVHVIVNGYLIGSVFESHCNEAQLPVYNKLFQGKVTSAYVKMENRDIIFTNEKGELDSEEREKFSLFLKAD